MLLSPVVWSRCCSALLRFLSHLGRIYICGTLAPLPYLALRLR